MSRCIKCGYEFTIKEKAKVGLTFSGNLKCPNCNSVYKADGAIRKIYYFIVMLAFFLVEGRFDFLNTFLEYLCGGIVLSGILILFDVIPHRWQKYRKIK